jgi:protein-tyrosine phosphatase
VAFRLARGERVLVTCNMGVNRSVFLAGVAIHVCTGALGAEIIKTVRRARAPAYREPSYRRRFNLSPSTNVVALVNPDFQRYLLGLHRFRRAS